MIMKIEVVGKNGLEITPAIKEYAEKKISKLEKYYNTSEELRATVLCKVYSDHHKVEVTIPSKHFTLRTETSDVDVYSAIDLSIDKLERQIRKFKTKVNKILREREGVHEFFRNDVDIEGLDKEIKVHNLVKNKQLKLVPLSVEEAIDQMEMTDHDFFVFLDEATMKVNILYVRQDGEYARIETDY